MRRIVSLLVTASVTAPLPAATVYHYESYDEDSGELARVMTRTVQAAGERQTRIEIEWVDTADSTSGRESYLVDERLSTLEWEVHRPSLDYRGKLEGDRLTLSGTKEDEELEAEHDLDERALYIDPTVGLQAFALSGQEKIEFWSLRPGKLSKHKMKAENEGIEMLERDSTQVEAVRVKWGLSGWKSIFFSQTLWFRAADGVLLQTTPTRGAWTKLIREEES